MSKPDGMHGEDGELLRLADGELKPSEADTLRRHLAACPECDSRFHAIRRAEEAYLEYHDALKACDPQPPLPWENLRAKLEQRTAPLPSRGGAYRVWLAAAAAIAIGAIIFYRVGRTPQVSAAALLRRAVAEAPRPDAARRIRVRAGGRSVVRAAVVHGSEPARGETDLAALFLAARFSWEDPLSARSFAAWRDQLPERQDRVDTVEGLYQIHTATHSGVLTEAVLMLSVRDLHPVRETMRFEHQVVEIDEAEREVAPPPVTPHVAAEPAPASPVRPAGPAEELSAIAALHGIGADLGEPVEVNLEGGLVVVKGTGLSPRREQQVRDAVSGLPRVTVQFDKPGIGPLNAGDSGRVAAGERSQLQMSLGEEAINRILDASEAMMARAYAMRSLSRRFPHDVEANLADAGRGVLETMLGEHSSAMASRLRDLETALAPVLPQAPVAVSSAGDWQTCAARTFNAAETVDQLLNRMLAGGGNASVRLPDLATALQQLDAEVRACRNKP